MITGTQHTSIKYLEILCVLRQLLADKIITQAEYSKAKKYYKKLTGADLAIAD